MTAANNVVRVVESGLCTGCGACAGCEHLTLTEGPLGFPVPAVDEGCVGCGQCLARCLYDPERDDE